MHTFREVAGKELAWVRIGGRRERSFELRAGDEIVAELAFDSRLSESARAQCGDGAWRFERQGVVRRMVQVTPEQPVGHATPDLVATLQPGRIFRPTVVELGPQRYSWTREGLLTPWRSLQDETGPLIRTRRSGLSVTGRGLLETQAAAFARPELPLMALVCWYLTARGQGKED